jgi:UDP-2,4-diacetamido-2,4,6-trideoxy-beta-L-altropyranose hydrolase
MVNLLIRADGGIRTGTGHLMRCLALAQACQAHGGEAIFLSHCQSLAVRQRIKDLGFGLIALEEPHPAPTDLRTTLSVFARLTADQWQSTSAFLILDGYHFDSAYQRAIQEAGHKVLVIDDTGHLPRYSADVLLNHGINAGHISYTLSARAIPLLGSRYALLRPEFLAWRDWQREVPAVARHILVTLGGSDPRNATRQILRALARLPMSELAIRVVIGPANPWRDELQRIVQEAPHNVQLLTNVSDMPQLMAWADVAVCAGGGTCWELAFMGVPMVVVVLADNQRGVAKGLSEYGIGVNCGEVDEFQPGCVAEEVQSLLQDQTRRIHMSTVGRVVVDGQGAERVLTLLSQLRKEPSDELVQIRPATFADAGLLWQWANDPLTRANSFHDEAIAWEQHVDWYEAKLRAAGTRMWMLEYLGVPVGQIRYDRSASDLAQISYVVAQGWRGRGIGVQLLMKTSFLACTELQAPWLQGVTFVSNRASTQAFRHAGYQVVKEEIIDGRPCLVFGWKLST